MDKELDEILFFQSEPMSSNMLADWQIKEAKQRIGALIEKKVRGEYLKGYNSGWVKANRLNKKPEAVEYFADQLEQAAKTLREAVAQLQDNQAKEDKNG